MKYSLLDTNAISAILKGDEVGIELCKKGVKEGWQLIYHPGVAAELAQLGSAKHRDIKDRFPLTEAQLHNYDRMIRREQQRIDSSDLYRFLEKGRFGIIKSPSEILSQEMATYDQPAIILPCENFEEHFLIHDEIDLARFVEEARVWSNAVRDEAADKHRRMEKQAMKDRESYSKISRDDLLRISIANVRSVLADKGFAEAADADSFRFPSLQTEFFALWYKFIEGNRKPKANDQFDLLLFYILPYIQVFITEHSNVEIVKKIKSFGLLGGLEVIPVSYKQ